MMLEPSRSLGVLRIVPLAIAVASHARPSEACTLAVVSAEAAIDGRPLLWKNRDKTSERKNEAKLFVDSPHGAYVGIVSSDDEEDTKVWSGVNVLGFSVANSLVRNKGYKADQNGVLMKQALMTCTTVEDFEVLLDGWRTGGITGNFVATDASGGAALFEARALTGERPELVRTDAGGNGPGFLAVANANRYGGGNNPGTERKARAEALLQVAVDQGGIGIRDVLQAVARDLNGLAPPVEGSAEVDTTTFISQYRTRSVSVTQGVRAGEDPRYAVFWVLLGEPAFGVSVPLFAMAGAAPDELTAEPEAMAPFHLATEEQELRSYDDNLTDRTLRPYPLWSWEDGRPPLQATTLPLEDLLFALTAWQLELCQTRSSLCPPRVMLAFQESLVEWAYWLYTTIAQEPDLGVE